MIEVRSLTKKYAGTTAVDNISFTIEAGKIYGLLGPNGAGKSTTMNIITGCLAATGGSVKINGHDIFEEPLKAKKLIGYLPEIPPLYPDMTPFEYLTFVAEAKNVEYETALRQVREVMELTQLMDVADRLIGNLSKGYRQRVGIAQAMLGNPDIIILDEPTVGLDPKQIIEIRDLIRTLGEVKTVILSSHILAEVAEVCEHVIIINRGKIVADDTIANLTGTLNKNDTIYVAVRGSADIVGRVLRGIDGILELEQEKSSQAGICRFKITVKKDSDLRDAIVFALADRRCAVIGIETEKSSLENIFLTLTESGPQDGGDAPHENRDDDDINAIFADDEDDDDSADDGGTEV